MIFRTGGLDLVDLCDVKGVPFNCKVLLGFLRKMETIPAELDSVGAPLARRIGQ